MNSQGVDANGIDLNSIYNAVNDKSNDEVDEQGNDVIMFGDEEVQAMNNMLYDKMVETNNNEYFDISVKIGQLKKEKVCLKG